MRGKKKRTGGEGRREREVKGPEKVASVEGVIPYNIIHIFLQMNPYLPTRFSREGGLKTQHIQPVYNTINILQIFLNI